MHQVTAFVFKMVLRSWKTRMNIQLGGIGTNSTLSLEKKPKPIKATA